MAIVKKYPAKIVNMHNPIEGLYTLELESIDKPFKYKPGQFLHLAIDEYDHSSHWPESRCFSMQSAPAEDLIRITYAVKGTFTSRMQNELKPGKTIILKLPYGDLFTQPHNKVNTVFIAGGTGITPFLSLFADESFKTYMNPRIYLGFRSLRYNIYAKDLKGVNEFDGMTIHQNPTIYYEDVDGLMNIAHIFSENSNESDYFVSGPPLMIHAFKKGLHAMGVPMNHIFTDEWE